MIKIFTFIAIGFLMVCGMRAAEYLIPKPETRVLICFENVDSDCKKLSELNEV